RQDQLLLRVRRRRSGRHAGWRPPGACDSSYQYDQAGVAPIQRGARPIYLSGRHQRPPARSAGRRRVGADPDEDGAVQGVRELSALARCAVSAGSPRVEMVDLSPDLLEVAATLLAAYMIGWGDASTEECEQALGRLLDFPGAHFVLA